LRPENIRTKLLIVRYSLTNDDVVDDGDTKVIIDSRRILMWMKILRGLHGSARLGGTSGRKAVFINGAGYPAL